MRRDVLSAELITQSLAKRDINLAVQVERKVDSTNNVLKSYAASGKKGDMVLLAEEQSAGRGRRGRSFFSPEGTGLYMSLLLHPQMQVEESTMLTTLAAVAAVEAIEAVTREEAKIKWVNDIFVRGKKISGILTEASISPKDGKLEYVIVGIGINLYEPDGGFPEELREVAGAVRKQEKAEENLRNCLAAEFLVRFMEYYKTFPARNYLEEYRNRSLVIGKRVRILEPEGADGRTADRADNGREYAQVLGIDDNCHLQVQYDDGTIEYLSSGEISIRL